MADSPLKQKVFPPAPAGRSGWPWTVASDPLPPFMPDGRPLPKISIVTPSYNQGQFLEETIRSVLLQGYPNLEYIIMDGGSTDNSVEIIKKYEPWLTYWVSEKDNGQADAIHRGFKRSTGEIYAWINSDDYLLPDVLYKVGTLFAAASNIEFVIGGGIVVDARGLQPHRMETFKLSRDPKFVEKLTDVVGLYLNPPDKAIVLCVDEKSQIQALDRTQPGLPMKKGRCATMTHDYKRNGTTTLFAALSVLEGRVIGQCLPRHRHQEFLKFLRHLDREFPKELPLHLILDNYGTHKHPNVTRWLSKHPRFQLHFTPTSSSWLNLVERWFRKPTQKRLRRRVFRSVPELIAGIEGFMASYNNDPKPFVWTA